MLGTNALSLTMAADGGTREYLETMHIKKNIGEHVAMTLRVTHACAISSCPTCLEANMHICRSTTHAVAQRPGEVLRI